MSFSLTSLINKEDGTTPLLCEITIKTPYGISMKFFPDYICYGAQHKKRELKNVVDRLNNNDSFTNNRYFFWPLEGLRNNYTSIHIINNEVIFNTGKYSQGSEFVIQLNDIRKDLAFMIMSLYDGVGG